MRKISIILMALAFALVPGAVAFGQDNSAVDEYSEGVPGGAGEQPGSEAGDGSPLPSSVVSEFEEAGADGSAAADLAQASGGPDRDSRSSAGADRDGGSGGGGLGQAITEVVDPDSDSGMGVALPIILGAALLAAVALAVSRARGPRTPA